MAQISTYDLTRDSWAEEQLFGNSEQFDT